MITFEEVKKYFSAYDYEDRQELLAEVQAEVYNDIEIEIIALGERIQENKKDLNLLKKEQAHLQARKDYLYELLADLADELTDDLIEESY